jgi:DNA-binding beta-propeller fold protein YncE
MVYRLSLDGKTKEKLAQMAPGLDNLAITPEGDLYVTSYWDATVYKVSTDGSGKYETLFATGLNQPMGIAIKGDRVLVADAIMVRTVELGKYVKTKLNAFINQGMPLPTSLSEGPGDQVFWATSISGAVVIGNAVTGEFKAVASGLNGPVGVLMEKNPTMILVAEYSGGQISEVNLANGAKRVVTTGLEGPLALAWVGDALYVAEAKAGRVSKVDPATGRKEVFVVGVCGKPTALGNDGEGNLLILDGAGTKLIRVNPKNMAISTVASSLPVGYSSFGSYPLVEIAWPMSVSARGDVYLATEGRGVIKLEKEK